MPSGKGLKCAPNSSRVSMNDLRIRNGRDIAKYAIVNAVRTNDVINTATIKSIMFGGTWTIALCKPRNRGTKKPNTKSPALTVKELSTVRPSCSEMQNKITLLTGIGGSRLRCNRFRKSIAAFNRNGDAAD